MPRLDHAEKGFGNGVALPHSVQQPSRRKLRRDGRAHIGDQQREIHHLEQKKSADLPGHHGEGGFHLIRGKRLGAPDQLRRIDFQSGQQAGDEADQHRREQDIAARIFRFLRQGRYGVKADIGQNRDRGARENAVGMEIPRFIKRMQEESGIVVNAPQEIDHRAEEKNDHQHHAPRTGFHSAWPRS